MIVVAALGAAFRVASGPHANVHGVDGHLILIARDEQMAGEQVPQRLGVDASPVQRGVEAAPSATMRHLEAQMSRRRGGAARCEDGIGEFKEGVAPAVETFVERAAESLESIGRFHDEHIMHPPRAFRTPYLPVELKRKLRGCISLPRIEL